MKYTLAIILILFCGIASADNMAKDQKRLENMQKDLEHKKEALEKQQEAVKAMEKKLECNYNMLQAYNQCEEDHKKNSDEYAGCMKKAKEVNSGCMDNS